jgi:hypothetical protein
MHLKKAEALGVTQPVRDGTERRRHASVQLFRQLIESRDAVRRQAGVT